MWKVILVEDEPFVRRKIRKMVDWQSYGFTIAGEAGNGEEAMEMILDKRPHLVISDIVMPVMNGIELLRKVRESGLDCHFIMLTCMDEFEYAQQALEYGALNYVLKLSLDLDELCNMLLKVDERLLRDRKEKGLLTNQDFQQWYEQCWRIMIDDRSLDVNIPLPSYMEYGFMCCVLHGKEPFYPEDFMRLELFPNIKDGLLHHYSNQGLTTFFYWSENPILLHHQMPEVKGIVVTYTKAFHAGQMAYVWQELLTKINEYWYHAKLGITYCVLSPGNSSAGRIKYTWSKQKELFHYFEQMNMEHCERLLQEIWMDMQDQKLSVPQVKENAEGILGVLAKILGDQNPHLSMLQSPLSHQQLQENVIGYMKQGLNSLLQKQHVGTDHEAVNQVLKHISQNYDSNITLRSMAKYVNVDEYYLSGLFKKKVGKTFIIYVQHYRIEKAKTFLKNTEWPINEVGYRVGFVNDNYFSKIFKRWTGQTPGHFRKQALSSKE